MALSIQTRSFQSISSGSRYFDGCCGVVLSIALVTIGVEAWVATAGSAPKPSVKIAQKGDRLPLVPPLYRNVLNQPLNISIPSAPTSNRELADGCESLVSSLSRSPLKHIASRCLS
jgi:hypothetical protein